MHIAVPDFVSSTFFPLIAAKELGIFDQEGQDVEIVHSNALGAVEYLRDGTADLSAGPAHVPMMIFPDSLGVKLVVTVSQGTPWLLVMKAGLAKRGEIESVKGRRIAANRGPDLVLKYLLHEAGIDVEKDLVKIGPLPETDQPGISFGVASARALADGRVDGIWANVLGCEVAVHLGAGSVIMDTRLGDGPAGAGNYSFIALAATESKIETEPERIEAVIRSVVRAQSVLRQDPWQAKKIATKLFPAVEAGLMGQIVARDAEFYQPFISLEAIGEMNRFATAVGLLSSPVSYEQVVATQFRSLWSE
jgi:ABC-type nitrate/sulfonate/bicarbonate transport system substrate-binding protein